MKTTLTKHQAAIKRALDLQCSGGQRVTPEMKQSWMIALNDCEPEYIDKATNKILQDGHDSDYLIKTDKFRAICQKIKRDEKTAAEVKQNPQSNTYSIDKSLSKKEARRIQKFLKKGMPVFNKIPCPKIDMVDYLNPEGDIVKIVSIGHVNIKDFKNNCANQFLVKLQKCFHGYHRQEKKTSEVTKKYKTMAQCASDSGGDPITIGIV